MWLLYENRHQTSWKDCINFTGVCELVLWRYCVSTLVFCLLVFETKYCHIMQAAFKYLTLLPQPPESWNYRHIQPHPVTAVLYKGLKCPWSLVLIREGVLEPVLCRAWSSDCWVAGKDHFPSPHAGTVQVSGTDDRTGVERCISAWRRAGWGLSSFVAVLRILPVDRFKIFHSLEHRRSATDTFLMKTHFWHRPFTPALERLRQTYLCEFKATLGYIIALVLKQNKIKWLIVKGTDCPSRDLDSVPSTYVVTHTHL